MDHSGAINQVEIQPQPPAQSRNEFRNRPAGKHLRSREPASASLTAAFEADRGYSKANATRLFHRLAAHSPLPTGKLRAELIPDSSWKRAGKILGPQASQTTARLSHVLALAEGVWGNQDDAIAWLSSPHPELRGATPYSLLKTEAGGRAVEALLAALDFGFPV